MSKNPVSKSKPVKRNEPMHNALKFFLAGCVAEIYLLVIRRFYVNGTANELLACDAALPYLMAAGAAVAVIGLVLGIVWRQQTKRRCVLDDFADMLKDIAVVEKAPKVEGAAGSAGRCLPPAFSWAVPPG